MQNKHTFDVIKAAQYNHSNRNRISFHYQIKQIISLINYHLLIFIEKIHINQIYPESCQICVCVKIATNSAAKI